MRVLIVNNGQRYPARLVSLLPTATVEVVAGLAVSDQYPVAPHVLSYYLAVMHIPSPIFTTY